MQHCCVYTGMKRGFLGLIFSLSAFSGWAQDSADTTRSLQAVEILAKKNAAAGQVVQEISAKEIEALRGKPLAEMLEKVPGVTTLRTGYAIAKPMIHGMWGSRVVLLNNGIRHEGQQWGNEHAPEVDMFSAGTVRVVKGAESVRYGSDAIAGVVLVEPPMFPPTSPKALSGSLYTGLVSNGRRGMAALRLQGYVPKVAGLAWRVQASTQRGGDISTPTYRLLNTGMAEYAYSATIQYRHKNAVYELFGSNYATTLGIFRGAHIGSTSDLQVAIQQAQPLPQYTPNTFSYAINRPRQEVHHAFVKIKTTWQTGGGSLQAVYAFQQNHRDEYDNKPRGQQLLDLPQLRLVLQTHTAEIIWKKLLNEHWTSESGASAMLRTNTQSGRQLIPSYVSPQGGAFQVLKYRHSRYQMEAGLRYDFQAIRITSAEPDSLPKQFHFGSYSAVLGGKYTLNERISLGAQASSAWRPPNINELFSNGIHQGAARFEQGNAQLSPEKALNASLSVELRGNRWNAEVQGFYSAIKNYIYAAPTGESVLTISGAFLGFRYKATDAVFTGVDAQGTYQLGKNWRASGQAAYLYVRDVRHHSYLIGIAPNRLNGALTYTTATRHFSEIALTLGGTAVAQQRHIPIGTAEQPADYLAPPPAYQLLSFQASAKAGKWRISLATDNLLNTRYRDYLNAFRYFSDEMGRSIRLSAGFEW